MREKRLNSLLLILLIQLLTGVYTSTSAAESTNAALLSSKATTTKNAREGENVVLECRFPNSGVNEGKWYWTRTKPGGKYDTVAFEEQTFNAGYRVNYDKRTGIYDLAISATSYERDNGVFECRNVAKESGAYLHNSTTNLVILFEPGRPILTPMLPNLTESRPFDISCASIGGSPPPAIQWFKNGILEDSSANSIIYEPALDRDTPSVSTITIIPEKDDDGSEYKCTVWNEAIDKTQTMEETTKINVNYYPRVRVGPENPVRVERNDPATLECNVDSKPRVQDVKWMRNSRFISLNFRHVIQKAGLKDAGPYICSADNGLGKVVEQELELDVLYGPEVSVAELAEFSETEDISVACNVTANPPPHAILWTKEGDAEFKQEGAVLRLSANRGAANNNGRYTCTAVNTVRATGRQPVERKGAATIQVAVKHAPGTTYITPEKPTVLEGERITLECGADPPGYPQPTYTWSREGSLSSVLATGSSFTIDGARLDSSGGRYFCRPANSAGLGTIGETVLNVYQPPRLESQPLRTIVKRSGDTGYLVTCSAVGKPQPQITWFKDDVEIDPEESDLFQISVNVMDKKEAFNVISTLNFIGPGRLGKRKLMATDRGHYTCRFKNEVGQAESSMLLRIEHSPVVRHQHNKVAADLTESVRIPCRMQSYPQPRFEWSKSNNVLIERQGRYRMTAVELEDDIYEGSLEIARVDDSSYGQYACKATNQLGAQKTLITLQPRGEPERPDRPEAIEVRPDSVLLKWREGFNGGFNETTYNIEYAMEGASSEMKHHDCRLRNPCNISGLEQYTKYSFKVKAVNIRGNSPWSRDLSITTAVDVDKIPRAEHIFYETSSRSVSFNVINYPLGLVAKIELENPDKTYRPHAKLGMNDRTFGQMSIDGKNSGDNSATTNAIEPVTGVRVRLCLSTDESLCGEYGFAEIVEVRQSPYGTNAGALPMEGVIAIVIFAGILAIAAIGLVIKCCFCSNSHHSSGKSLKLTKDDITGPNSSNRLQNNFKNYAMDSKGVSAKDSADSPDIIKSQMMYGQYNFSASVPGAQVPAQGGPTNAGYDQSSSNSHNGGSVNSQDSLWNVKHPMPSNNMIDPGMTGFVTASGYYPPNSANIMTDSNGGQGYNGQYGGGAEQYNGQYPGGDGYNNGGQFNHGGQQQYNYEEYTHYPHPEEYINERNRAYLPPNSGMTDQYAMPNKSRSRLESDYSAYGDISTNGMEHPHSQVPPHHYTPHDISAELRAQEDMHMHGDMVDGGNGMAPAPEGYSTPSRRVIREIIV